MNAPKKIKTPELKSARKLNGLELNGFRFDVKHTVLTPELLEKMTSDRKRGSKQAIGK